MPTIPFWTPRAARPATRLPARVDLAIAGGGITGVCAARWAAASGMSVAVLERAHLAAGASGRNAGFLLGGVAESYAAAVRRYGRAVARDVWALTEVNHARLLELGGGTLPGYRRLGSLVAAAGAVERDELEESAQLLKEDGVSARWDARGKTRGGASFGVLEVPGDGEVDPAAAVEAIAAPVRASIHEGVEMLAVEQRGDIVRLETSAGEVAAGAVLLALNGYTAAVAPQVPIRAVRAQMLATEPVRTQVAARPTYARRGYDYWRQLPDGRVLVGGRRDVAVDAEVGDADLTTDAVQSSLDELRTELGAGAARVTHRWSGVMGFSPDGLPLVGTLPGSPRIAVCGGYTGHGMGFAAECSRIAVGLLNCDERPPRHLDLVRARDENIPPRLVTQV